MDRHNERGALPLPILGISPRNSYYGPANIDFVLGEVLRDRPAALVMIPDVPDIHNYLAYGYEPPKAEKKALSLGRALKATVEEICAARDRGCGFGSQSPSEVRIIDWRNDVEDNAIYRSALAEIQALYKSNSAFQSAIRETSLHSLKSKMANESRLQRYLEKTGTDKSLDHAVQYILSEIGFLDAAPSLFGRERIEYIYHRPWPVYEQYIKGGFDNPQHPSSSFRIVARAAEPGRP
ncbi:MAG: tRNA-dependent cyclodipeptide synthase [Pseudomonadota bacterium]|nr:tRNA-dependent cyclodipeptide synthase [Pseudomonadota bacterium]